MTFFRCLKRIVTFATILLVETAYLVLTVKRMDPSARMGYRAQRQSLACARAVRSIGIDVQISGQMPERSGFLIVSNHLGMIDPFVIAARFNLVFSGKAEMMSWPVAGWVLRSIGLIPVYRTRLLKTASFAQQVADRLDSGINVLAFPEGTTTAGTDVRPFKTGAFAALDLVSHGGVLPIILKVVSIDGSPPDPASHGRFTWTDSSRSLFSHLWSFLAVRSATIVIDIADPITSSGRSRKELANAAFEVVIKRSQMQKLDPVQLTRE